MQDTFLCKLNYSFFSGLVEKGEEWLQVMKDPLARDFGSSNVGGVTPIVVIVWTDPSGSYAHMEPDCCAVHPASS